MKLFTARDAQQLVEQQQALSLQDSRNQLATDLSGVFGAIERAAGQGQSRVRIRGLQSRPVEQLTYLTSLGYDIASDSIVWSGARVGQAGAAADIEPKTIVLTLDQAFQVNFLVSGGVSPWTFVQSQGTLPQGVELGPLVNQTELILEGTPTRTGLGVVYIAVTDSYGTETVIRLEWTVSA